MATLLLKGPVAFSQTKFHILNLLQFLVVSSVKSWKKCEKSDKQGSWHLV